VGFYVGDTWCRGVALVPVVVISVHAGIWAIEEIPDVDR
jgi:hypothetical protein